MALRFDGKVAIVTGAGGGLGKQYALDLAARGAKVVVNDLGGSTKGEGADTRAADKVVNEIKAAGGEAVANYDSVVDGAKVVETAIKAYGRIDIVINNAGILRDVSFHKMKDQDWDLLTQVHLKGAYAVTRAAWPHMRNNKYGRIIFVASAAGLYGNFGQAGYSAMKLAVLGLCNTLSLEGKKYNVHANTIAPLAASRMTEGIIPPKMLQQMQPSTVSPYVLFLCHESCKDTGGMFEVGAGWAAKLRWQRSKGIVPAEMTVEGVGEAWKQISDYKGASHPTKTQETVMAAMQARAKAKL